MKRERERERERDRERERERENAEQRQILREPLAPVSAFRGSWPSAAACRRLGAV